MAHILLIEDDQTLSDLVREELVLFGHQVQCVNDGAKVEAALSANTFDLLLLDVMLPGKNGIELTQRIRSYSSVPILMITARGSEADRVAGLELGADDYLVKPFSLRELIARVHAQLRRAQFAAQVAAKSSAKAPSHVEQILDCTLDRVALSVQVQAQPVLLGSKEFELLCVFIDARGRALTREWLLTRVWGRDYDGSDRTVDNAVLKLREKLGRESAIAHAISAIRGVGYRMDKAQTNDLACDKTVLQ
jgi:DNA-binding response OmpR family regulator